MSVTPLKLIPAHTMTLNGNLRRGTIKDDEKSSESFHPVHKCFKKCFKKVETNRENEKKNDGYFGFLKYLINFGLMIMNFLVVDMFETSMLWFVNWNLVIIGENTLIIYFLSYNFKYYESNIRIIYISCMAYSLVSNIVGVLIILLTYDFGVLKKSESKSENAIMTTETEPLETFVVTIRSVTTIRSYL